MDAAAIKKLIARAQKDPQFFHTLIFEPEKALRGIRSRDPKSAAESLGIDPEEFMAAMIGAPAQLCGETCGVQSCKATCGRSCDSTCLSSCSGATCRGSCGFTTNVIPESGPVT